MRNTTYIPLFHVLSGACGRDFLVGMNRILASTLSAIGPSASQQDGVLRTDEIPYLFMLVISGSAMIVDGLNGWESEMGRRKGDGVLGVEVLNTWRVRSRDRRRQHEIDVG